MIPDRGLFVSNGRIGIGSDVIIILLGLLSADFMYFRCGYGICVGLLIVGSEHVLRTRMAVAPYFTVFLKPIRIWIEQNF